MRERDLYRAVDRHLPATLFRQSMTGAAMTGTGVPDRYYDGVIRDLWVEYKMLRAVPRSGTVIGAYSARQLLWMQRRWEAGHNVLGVVGLPTGMACIQSCPGEWLHGTDVNAAVPLNKVSEWIAVYCGVSSRPSAPS